ncbi:MAG: NnrU family protein [Pseudomonadota bacterium]
MTELWPLALASLVFVGGHLFLSSKGPRAFLVQSLGEKPFLGFYSLVAAVALAGMIWAFNTLPHGAPLWLFYPAGFYAAIIVMPIALLLVIGGYSQRNPTAIGQDRALRRTPKGILRITRHPTMWGVALWAIGHLLANGDPASVLFFGAFLVLALGGTVAIDRKKRRAHGDVYDGFCEQTSNLPFLAIARGRQSFAMAAREFGLWRLALVVVAYGVLLHLHRWAFGVAPYPGL